MADVFFSEAAYRIIPIGTCLIGAFGLACGLMLLGIAVRNHTRHIDDPYRSVAEFIHRRAVALAILSAIPFIAGILFTVAWPPLPPTQGRTLALWVNHYIVGSGSVVASRLTYTALRKRLRIEHGE